MNCRRSNSAVRLSSKSKSNGCNRNWNPYWVEEATVCRPRFPRKGKSVAECVFVPPALASFEQINAKFAIVLELAVVGCASDTKTVA
jgi:hypothetical protein